MGPYGSVATKKSHLTQQINTVPLLFSKISPVSVVFKDRFALYSPDDDVMQGAGSIYAGLTWHGIDLSDHNGYVNI